jgi:alpha-beta hydrolase superfamily lysophospholipase
MPDLLDFTTDESTARDGVRLARFVCRPRDAARAVVAVVHGYGEHGERYRQLAGDLAERGLCTCVYDLRGHGRSAGPRGHVSRFKEYLDDTAQFLDWARLQARGLPLFLLGHSMGGLIAASFVEQRRPNDLAGLVLSAPFLRLAEPVPRYKLVFAHVASVLVPSLDVGNTLDAAGLSRDDEVVAAYRADPLNHGVATARWATEVLSAQKAALAHAGRISQRLLVMAGGDDPVAHPDAARELFAAAGSRDKRLLVYPGFLHEIFNEQGRQTPVADLLAWLDERLRAA